jgi:glycosyltransferase involved in cell wall biosynthesis
MTTPLSFIVLSYNYENYIRITLQSILDQTVQDFEVIVVDDASLDRSCEVVRSFNDPRIRLITNERNLGGAASYNVAVKAARGEWLVNLDADDWIAPQKSVRQLKAARQNPQVDIIGTWANLVGSDGTRHPDASLVEPHWNGDYALNLVDTWIGRNHLCRSSTMVRRAAHLRIGLDDEGMVAAPDYELWTRALAQGCRFHLVKEQLTFSRLHPRGITRADLHRSFLEISFALLKNIVPLIERQALWPSFSELLRWVGTHRELAALSPRERERLLALLMTGAAIPAYADFRAVLAKPDSSLETIGRRALFTLAQGELAKTQDVRSLLAEVERLKGEVRQLSDACKYLKSKSEQGEQDARRHAQQLAEPEHAAKQPTSALAEREHAAEQPTSAEDNTDAGHHSPNATEPKPGLIRRAKRWIAPGKGRWVRTKARLSRAQRRFSRFFRSRARLVRGGSKVDL